MALEGQAAAHGHVAVGVRGHAAGQEVVAAAQQQVGERGLASEEESWRSKVEHDVKMM